MATSFRTPGMSLVAGFRKWFPLVPCDLLPVVELLTILTQCLQGTAPGRWGWDFKCVNLKHNMEIDIFSIQINIIPEWKPEDPVGNVKEIWKRFYFHSLYNKAVWAFTAKLLSGECHKTLLMISENCYG